MPRGLEFPKVVAADRCELKQFPIFLTGQKNTRLIALKNGSSGNSVDIGISFSLETKLDSKHF
jgi:hypothetical protein